MSTQLNETRKEDDIFYKGAFWIIARSVKDLLRGDFEIVGEKLYCDYSGKLVNYEGSANSLTHQRLWRDKYKGQLNSDKEYNYYPRGRVELYNGDYYIHINSLCNTPKVIDAINDFYEVDKRLGYEIELNDETQGSHYDFQLQ